MIGDKQSQNVGDGSNAVQVNGDLVINNIYKNHTENVINDHVFERNTEEIRENNGKSEIYTSRIPEGFEKFKVFGEDFICVTFDGVIEEISQPVSRVERSGDKIFNNTYQTYWIKMDNGNENEIVMRNVHQVARIGNRVSLFGIYSKKGSVDIVTHIFNHNSRQWCKISSLKSIVEKFFTSKIMYLIFGITLVSIFFSVIFGEFGYELFSNKMIFTAPFISFVLIIWRITQSLIAYIHLERARNKLVFE